MAKSFWMKQSRQENMIYLAVWALLFAAPLLSLYVRTVSDANLRFDWTEVFVVWRMFAVYLILFLIHNFLLAPMLVHGHRRTAYFSFVAVVMAAFVIYQCSSRPKDRGHRPDMTPRMEQPDWKRPPMDEPSMGLSPLLVKEIFRIIQDINKQGTTVLLVEQNAKMALAIADRAYVLETGKIILEGTGAELAASEQVRKAYLGG